MREDSIMRCASIAVFLIAALLSPTAALHAGWLGVTVGDVVGTGEEEMGAGAVLIEDVVPDSPADRAGLAPGDRILGVEGLESRDCAQVAAHIRETPSGEVVRLRIRRGDREMTVPVTLGDPPADAPGGKMEIMRPQLPPLVLHADKNRRVKRAWLGVEMMALSEGLSRYFDIEEGVLVSRVAPDSPAEKAGLRAGDIVVSIDGQEATGPAQVQELVHAHEAGDRVRLEVVREGRSRTVEPVLEEKEAEAVFFGLVPEGDWSETFDSDVWLENLQRYKETLHGQLQRSTEDRQKWMEKLEQMGEAAQMLKEDEALRRLLEANRLNLEKLREGWAGVGVAPGATECKRDLAEQERRIRELEAELRSRDARLRDLESRLRRLERER